MLTAINRRPRYEPSEASSSQAASSSSSQNDNEFISRNSHETTAQVASSLLNITAAPLPKTEGKLSLLMRQTLATLQLLQAQPNAEDPSCYTAIANFCKQTVAPSAETLQGLSETKKLEALAECEKILDSVLFLTQKDPLQACCIINEDKPVENLKKAVLELMQDAKKRLEDLRGEQELYGLQKGAEIYANQLPLVISQLLIVENKLALGLIDSIKAVFIPPTTASFLPVLSYIYTDTRPSYIIYLEQKLNDLRTHANLSPENYKQLQEDIRSIQKPTNGLTQVELLIRATLGLKMSESVCHKDARVCAAYDYFNQPRQKETGTCYVERQQIWTQMYRPDIGFADDRNIFATGGLVRVIDGEPKTFRFNNQIADWDLENCFITIDKDGTLVNRSTTETILNVWNTPGIQKTLSVAGITDSPELRQKALEIVMAGQTDSTKAIHVEELLNAAVVAWKQLNRRENRKNIDLQYTCYFAFSAQTHCPLQRVKMDMLSRMAQASSGGYLSYQVDACVASAFRQIAETLQAPAAANDKEVFKAAEVLSLLFIKTFSNMKFWTYENLGDVTDRPAEGNSGQWVLRGKDGSSQGQRMDSPEVFQAFLTKVAETTWKDSGAVEIAKTTAEVAKAVMDQITAIVNTENFVNLCFRSYRPGTGNDKIENPAAQWKDVDHTPIRDRDGGPEAVVVNQFFDVSLPIMKQFKPTSAENALSTCAEFYRTQLANDPKTFERAWPMVIPDHAVNFWPDERMGNPKVVANLNAIGQTVAKKSMPMNMALDISTGCFKLIDEKDRTAARAEFRNSIKNAETVGSYSKKLLSTILAYTPKEKEAVTTEAVCKIVLDNLPPVDFKTIANSAIRVLDLNWEFELGSANGQSDIHALFGKFYFDPTLGKIQLAEVSDDKSYIKPIQSEFLGNPGVDVWGAYPGNNVQLGLGVAP